MITTPLNTPDISRTQSAITRQALQELVISLRESISQTHNPQARAMFETTAEVLKGVINAFEHFEKHQEEAWQDPQAPHC